MLIYLIIIDCNKHRVFHYRIRMLISNAASLSLEILDLFFIFGLIKFIWWIFKKTIFIGRILFTTRSPISSGVTVVTFIPEFTTRSPDSSGVTIVSGIPELLSYSAKEQWHIVSMINGKKHIGLVIEIFNSFDEIVLCVDLLMPNATEFYKFPMDVVKSELLEFAEYDDEGAILASHVENFVGPRGYMDVYEEVSLLKTHWIRIIQRKWRSYIIKRQRRLLLRGTVAAQRQFELTGNWN